jgi:hypothetical protein
MSSERSDREEDFLVLNAEPGDYRVTLNLIMSVSTSTNVSFEKLAREFSKRMSDKAATILVAPEEKKAP